MRNQCGEANAKFLLGGLKDPKFPKYPKEAYEIYKDQHVKEKPEDYHLFLNDMFNYHPQYDALSEEEKVKYKAMEKEEKDRYDAAVRNYNPPSSWCGADGRYRIIGDWDGGYLPRRGIFPPDPTDRQAALPVDAHAMVGRAPWSDGLNPDILSAIGVCFEHPRDVFSMSYVCSNWLQALSHKKAIAQEAVWRPLAMSRFPQLFEKKDGEGVLQFVLENTRFTYRDVFIIHDRVTGLDPDAELQPPTEEDQIHDDGLEEKDFMFTFILTHYSTDFQKATKYTFGMCPFDYGATCHVPNFHDMVLATDYDSEMNDDPHPDRSTISVLRCFLTGPRHKTVMVLKFVEFDEEWGGEGFYYVCSAGSCFGAHNPKDRNKTLPTKPTLYLSGGEQTDYTHDELYFEFETRGELLDIYVELFRGKVPSAKKAKT